MASHRRCWLTVGADDSNTVTTYRRDDGMKLLSTMKAATLAALTLSAVTAVGSPSVLAREQVSRSAPDTQVLATAPGQIGQSQTVQGVTVTLQQLRSGQEPAKGKPHEASP